MVVTSWACLFTCHIYYRTSCKKKEDPKGVVLCVYEVCVFYECLSRVSFSISYFESIVLLMIYAASMFTWCPHAKPVAKRPNTRNGCAAAWYFTSFLIGSGKKNLNCAKICGAIKQNKTLE